MLFHIKTTSGWVNDGFMLWVKPLRVSFCGGITKRPSTQRHLLPFCTVLTRVNLLVWNREISHTHFKTVKLEQKHLLKTWRVALWDTFSSRVCVTWTANHWATWLHSSRANPDLTALTRTNSGPLWRPKPPFNYITLPLERCWPMSRSFPPSALRAAEQSISTILCKP